ncbi:MAG TPA: FAD-dependent oxidoreductase [Egibacteraceae bacterium]|nr:FAD-dependent oxidoreductase [Egibacteraceae bacterium]
MTADLVVLGAGPAGLGAAYRAARGDHRVVVLERAAGPGGAAASLEVGGIRVDLGSHRLHPSTDPAILADLRALLGDDLQRRPRRGRIRLAGRWIAFPLRPGDLARQLPPSLALAAAWDAATAWARRPGADTFAEVLRAGLGPTLCERFYFPYARKLWGLAPDELSGQQARRRVSADSPAKLLRRVLSGAAGGGFFYYPRGGFGQISERLAQAAAAAGAQLRFGAAAERVALRPDGVVVTVAGGGSVAGRRLWSTIPLAALARMSEPAAPPDVLEAAGRLETRSLVLVYLVLPVGRYSPYDAHYLPAASTPVTRISEPTNYRDGDDPPGRTVLCAELPCRRDDDLWTADDPTLAAIVRATLRGHELPDVAPVEVAVRRLAQAYPVYRAGFEPAFATLDAWAHAQPALLTFGRQGLFVHDNSHHALAMAWAAAAALRPGGGFDDAAWAAARARFAAHVVED